MLIQPPCYSVMLRGGEKYGILDLPSGYVPVERYMTYQSLHGIPIAQGWKSRLNRRWDGPCGKAIASILD